MLRGLAALLVLIGHLRAFVFRSYGELASPDPFDTVFWIVTGLSHQAVMVFFVLSGFFITRSIVLDDQVRGFSWTTYLIKRLTRLWIVLIPCLTLTLFWDSIGTSLAGKVFYDGHLFATYNSGPTETADGSNFTLITFIENLIFLQTIVAPTFGSNGPLWSLANEFWYYLMFPLLYLLITRPRRWSTGVVKISLLVVICLFVGKPIALYGFIWLGGALAFFIYERGWLALWLRTSFAVVAAVGILLAALALSKSHYGVDFVGDAAVGFTAAILILVLSNHENDRAAYQRAARTLADASYTVYLAHFPFLALLANTVLKNRQFPNSALGYAVFLGLGVVTLVYCYVIYWMFEKHTPEVRRFCLTKFGRQTTSVMQA